MQLQRERRGRASSIAGPRLSRLSRDKFNEYSRFAEESRHASVPYFAHEALRANMAPLDLVRAWGRRKGATPAQRSLAWLLAEKPWIVPIAGTTKLHHLEEDLGANAVTFSPEEQREFRHAFSEIELLGVRSLESALTDGECEVQGRRRDEAMRCKGLRTPREIEELTGR